MKEENKNNLKSFSSSTLIGDNGLGKKAIWWLVGLFLLLIVGLFLPWQQNINGYGVLTAFAPQDRPQTIETMIAGRIEKWYVKEGDFVKKDDTILILSEIKEDYLDPELLSRLKGQVDSKSKSIASTEEKVQALQRQIKAILEAQKLNIEQARNKLKISQNKLNIDSGQLVAAKVDLSIAETQLARQKKLYDQGLKSMTELEQRQGKYQEALAKFVSAENKFLAAKNDLINSKLEIDAKQAEYNDKLSKAESDLNSTLKDLYESEGDLFKKRNYLSSIEIRSKNYVIRAPQDGYVVKALKPGIRQTVKERDAVATIMPANSKLAVALYIKAMDLPLIKVGQHVRVQFDGWPAIQFSGWPKLSTGTFGGKIAVIDYVESEKNAYRVLVIPDGKDPWPYQLRVGTGVYGWAMLNEVPVWYELWRQFNGFPPDLIDQFGDKKEGDKKDGDKSKSDEKK